jgi:DNA-binding YbaB/EbfC family protein
MEEKFMTKGLGGMLKQAQKIQAQLAKMQEEMAEKTIEASSGGGMVSVVVNGKQEVISVKIERQVVDPEDIDMLQDLVLAAVNEGIRKSQEMVTEEMKRLTGGLSIPGLF